MRPIRIALGRMPRLLRDIIVQVIGREQDMAIVGEGADLTEVGALLRREPADVVIVDGAAGDDGGRLLREHQQVKVLALSGDGRSAALHWLEPRLHTCSDVSPDGLVRLIRSACAPREATP
jgi:DNA-binding NarL/FixJ family response regulator